jgi:hypothetical protein
LCGNQPQCGHRMLEPDGSSAFSLGWRSTTTDDLEKVIRTAAHD